MKRLLFFFFFLFVSFKKNVSSNNSSFLPHENNERDDDSDFDVYSEEDLGTMKTMELRRAAKRRKEGGVNTTTTTADDDDAIDFDRTLALGKRLEIYMILFLTHFILHRIFRMAVHILRRGD